MQIAPNILAASVQLDRAAVAIFDLPLNSKTLAPSSIRGYWSTAANQAADALLLIREHDATDNDASRGWDTIASSVQTDIVDQLERMTSRFEQQKSLDANSVVEAADGFADTARGYAKILRAGS